MKYRFDWPSEWVYYLTSSFMFGAALLRSILLYYQIQDALVLSVGLLSLWLVLFLSQPAITRRWQHYFEIYLVIQSALAFRLLFNPEPSDFFALLYAILSAQIMRHYQPRTGTIIIALFTPLTFFALLDTIPLPMAIAQALIYLAANALLASYALASRRARVARAQNQASLQELQQANHDLEAYSQQIQQLTVARERNHLARELHDLVTQSIFSMTLTAQSALLLLERDSSRVGEQLDRLNELAQGALAEMQTLISELSPQKITEGGLVATLRRHIAERRLPEGLAVSVEVEGSQPLASAEEQGLFRIAQESLNNIVKHARASQANLHLHLAEPCWMEIKDNGQGFDMQKAQRGAGVGLSSMSERAAEIGWTLQVVTSPGSGTCIHLEKSGVEKHE